MANRVQIGDRRRYVHEYDGDTPEERERRLGAEVVVVGEILPHESPRMRLLEVRADSGEMWNAFESSLRPVHESWENG